MRAKPKVRKDKITSMLDAMDQLLLNNARSAERLIKRGKMRGMAVGNAKDAIGASATGLAYSKACRTDRGLGKLHCEHVALMVALSSASLARAEELSYRPLPKYRPEDEA